MPSAKVTGTTSFADYTFRVRAKNQQGESAWSMESAPAQFNYNIATGGAESTATRADGTLWKTHKFTANGALTVVTAIRPFTIIMSGGAKGGTSSACCGSCATPSNAGGTYTTSNLTTLQGGLTSYTFTRGNGGNGGPWPYPCTGGNCSPNGGQNGTNSTFTGAGTNLTAYGGGVNGANGPAVSSDIEGSPKTYIANSHGGGCGDGMAGGKGDNGFLYISYQIG